LGRGVAAETGEGIRGRCVMMGQSLSRPVDVVGEGESMWEVQMGAGRSRGVVEPVDHDGCYV
jgi:hypothetical protein